MLVSRLSSSAVTGTKDEGWRKDAPQLSQKVNNVSTCVSPSGPPGTRAASNVASASSGAWVAAIACGTLLLEEAAIACSSLLLAAPGKLR
jgi:hypothetical protein